MARHTPNNQGPTKSQTGAPPGLDLLYAMGTHAACIWVDMGNEAVRFICDWMQQNIRLQQAMLGATSFEELYNIQADHLNAARQDYNDEIARMLEMTGTLTNVGMPASGMTRRFDNLPL